MLVASGQSASPTPAAIHFQRQANRWLRLLRDRVEAHELYDDGSPSRFDYFDVLRSHLNISNGAVLEALHRAEITGDESAAATGTSLWRRSWMELKRFAYRRRRHWIRRYLGVTETKSFGGGRPVLAMPRHQGHLADISPVLRRLSDHYGTPTATAALDRMLARQAVDFGLSVVGVYGRPSPNGAARRRPQALMRTLDQAIETVAAESQEFPSEQRRRLAANTRESLEGLLDDAVETADAIEALLDSMNPQLVIIGNPYTYEGRLTALAARRRKIASLVIEHGSIFPEDPIWEDCTVDSVCVWGEPSRRALLSCGVKDVQIAVTGAPRYDAVFAKATDDTLRRDPQRAHLLVATSGPGDQVSLEQHCGFIRALFAVADRHPDIVWQVKLHKKDRPELYVDAAGRGRPNVRVNGGRGERENLTIFDYLRSARALVTISSTAALDAMAVSVPVITYDVWPSGRGLKGVAFLENGSTYAAADAERLAAVARRLWDGERDSAVDRAAQDYATWHFANRGSAAEAVARQAQRLMNRQAESERSHG